MPQKKFLDHCALIHRLRNWMMSRIFSEFLKIFVEKYSFFVSTLSDTYFRTEDKQFFLVLNPASAHPR